MKKLRLSAEIDLLHILLLTGLIGLGVGGVMSAQAFTSGQNHNGLPSVIPYQGTLSRDGQPFNGNKTITFALYDAASGGSVLWSSNPRSVDVIGGKFSVTLGDASGPAIEPAVFREQALYVAITIDGAELLPRQRIAPAPQAMVAGNGSPPGTIIAFAGQSIPPGWLPCDGSARNSQDYPTLAAVLAGAWGSDFGTSCVSSSGTCDFELPDLRGEFLRGSGPTLAVATKQEDTTRLPRAGWSVSSGGDHSHFSVRRTSADRQDPNLPHITSTGQAVTQSGDYKYWMASSANTPDWGRTSDSGTHVHAISGGDNETRPTNTAVHFIIKY